MPRISALPVLFFAALTLTACQTRRGTAPPPNGWANSAPTVVEQVVDREDSQLLRVTQGALQTWVLVPAVQAKVGDYVLLGQGTARLDVEIPELGERAREVVDIPHVQVVDQKTALRTVVSDVPEDAVQIATVYAELDQRADQEIVVYGTVVKATHAVGSLWVHLQDGTGHPSQHNFDLTLQTQQTVVKGQRVAFRGVLRKDVNIGFGYHYDALVEDAKLLE